jgi:hypothetical protein
MNPFEDIEKAEELLKEYQPTGDPNLDYLSLKALLAQERLLDTFRVVMFSQYKQGTSEAEEYVFREYMVRHKISKFALKLNEEVTSRITGEDPIEKSYVAICIKNRELYPKPVKKS